MKKYYHVVALCVSAEYKKCIGRFLKLCSVFISDLKHLRAQILVGSSIQSILCTFFVLVWPFPNVVFVVGFVIVVFLGCIWGLGCCRFCLVCRRK